MKSSPVSTDATINGVLFLGGGRAKRLNGVSKPHFTINGKTLLDYGLTCVNRTVGSVPCIAITAPDDRIPRGMQSTLEDPPFGGPIAGLRAGLAALQNLSTPASDDSLVAVFPADSPLAPLLIPQLTLASHQHDGAIVSWGNRLNYLIGVYRFNKLNSILPNPAHGYSAHSVLDQLNVAIVDDADHLSIDVDYSSDVSQVRRLLGIHNLLEERS
nr:NTP transferase domain-containing protein [Arcanobacterium phocae]